MATLSNAIQSEIPDRAASSTSKFGLWAGQIISALPALFLMIEGIMKLVKPAVVVEAPVKLGYPESVIIGLAS